MNGRDKSGVVLTGGDYQALGILRTLAKKHIPVIILDNDHCISRYSRYKDKFLKSPSPTQEAVYVNFLIALAKREKLNGWIIFPNSDQTVYVLSRNKKRLEEYYRVPTPCWDVIEKVYVKEKTYRIAEKNGIPIPKTYYPKNSKELLAMEVVFPVVLKPSIRDHFYPKTKVKAFLVENKKELINTYNKICEVIDPSEVLVQDFIPGGPSNLYSFCPFFKQGKAVAGMVARRSRQHPMDFGHATTFAEAVKRPELRDMAEKFLGMIGYYGIAEVEFMKDIRDGAYKIIEVNPRPWGWHTLAIAAGVDLPYMLYQDMMGEEVTAKWGSNSNKWVRLTTDIPTVCLEIMGGRMTLGEYVSSMRGKMEFAVFSLEDPFPFISEVAMLPYLYAKRGF